MAITKKKTLEEKYQSLSELEHIVKRSGMYLGSVKEEESQRFVYSVDDAKMQLKEVLYTPALLKIVDEAISNSCDEFRRKDNLGLTEISVTINTHSNEITIRDNGGIPVEILKNKDLKCYVPEFIFGHLRTSSNYDDTDERNVVGTNGLGIKLCNVASTKFSVYTADGKNSYYQSWSNNMQTMNSDQKIEKCKDHFSELKFTPDFKLFEDLNPENPYSEDFVSIIEKRCIDAAASNIGLNVKFSFLGIDEDENDISRNSEWSFNNFEEYIELYSDFIDSMDDVLKLQDKFKSIWIFPDGGLNIGFVNGAECSKGTHIKAVRNLINNAVSNQIVTKNKIDIKPKDVDNKYTLFCEFNVNNPAYDSQTKECLTTPVERFSIEKNYKFNIPDSFLKEVCKSEIVNIVVDWFKKKQEVEDEKTIRKLNKQAKTKLRNSDKFIDCNSRKPEERELWIFEGDSASAGFRIARTPQTQAAYLLRGKILNICDLGPTKIMENKELSDLITIIGLQWGVKTDKQNLHFHKIVIATDADEDGSSICGLLLNFFNLWPELYEYRIVCRSITPIITAIKGQEIKKYYNLPEYQKDKNNLKGYKITYLKGLGTQTNQLYKDMMRNPIFHYFKKDEVADITLKAWFGKGNASQRKAMLKNDVE